MENKEKNSKIQVRKPRKSKTNTITPEPGSPEDEARSQEFFKAMMAELAVNSKR